MVPGIKSPKWLFTTNANWPCVNTAALGRPVVPDVKKNQQGSSCSTEAAGASEQGLKAAQEIAQAIEDIASQADELQNG